MIATLMIANRGEIARRIMRTASSMGIRSVAVYAEGDRDAPYVREADRAIALQGRSAAETYLDIASLLAAATTSGADAVHPGYGFLSENAGFARAVAAAGLTWVGPPPDVIDAMADKIAAKALMKEAGVPVLPSWEPGDPDLRFPVMVKASAGGGGKGMRIVETGADLDDAVAAARREAQAAFGDPTVFLERYVSDARHVEVQVLADGSGGLVHCFERECSIQRRHQKVVEECPSPALDDETRERMCSAALAAAKAVGYRSAGTVEFVLEPSGEFWFLEVNTRLQVEHPVTEEVTGIDLVREQLMVAQGLPLSISQADVSIDGHAIEARIYAEDPVSGFLPASGTLAEWTPTGDVPARWDSGVQTGSVVGVDFDPMLAKVIAHAPTRAEAAMRLAHALERSRIRGVTTNRDFLVATLRHPEFLAGRATTSFIETSGVALRRAPSPDELRVAAIAAALSAQSEAREHAGVLRSVPGGWRNSVMPPEKRTYEHEEEILEVEYRARRDGAFEFGDATVRVLDMKDGRVDFELSGGRHSLHVHRNGIHVWVQGPEGDVSLTEKPRFPETGGAGSVTGGLVSPMPGRVLSIDVATGDRVKQGQLLLIVEAMKMEHRVTAPHAGTVVEIRATAGEQVGSGDVLVVLEDE